MRISKWEFEKELEALLNAALSAGNRETARRFLIEAKNKIYGYDDIPVSWRDTYLTEIEKTAYRLGIEI